MHCERQNSNHSRGEGHPSNSTQDRQTYKVLSMYSVHTINPQCVLTNITQLPHDRFMSVGEARSAPTDPRLQALKPQHQHCAIVFSHIHMQ